MIRVATWLRACDEAVFAAAFAAFPGMVLENARTGRVDLAQVDGLLLTGGGDIAAAHLVQPVPDPTLLRDTDPARDVWEFFALRQAFERRLPVLGICRGLQVVNVALGGTLYLDIPGHDLPFQKDGNVQQLRYGPGTSLRFPLVNSNHHQALDLVAPGLKVEGWCAADGYVEQVRGTRPGYLLGVQYHPERSVSYGPLFAEFRRAVDHYSRLR